MLQLDHEQTDFVTVDGETVQVDVGMFDILTELKMHGVRTRWSCEGTDVFGPYVCGTTRSFLPLFCRVRRSVKQGLYPESSMRMLEAFRTDHREFTLAWRKRVSERRTRLRFRKQLRRGTLSDQGYSIEIDINNVWGARTCLRWPTSDNSDILALLRETPRK